eukprot:TRINITY_DN4409_c0_g4_i1.p1 TRINITY_DN4409_c0_g4~~TRINITY_DN4409_c0_g4_i1.p1  ORF type:complete len:1321 (+),score=303.61 TRINITY_DN4409_c0_g4_i1:97-3963(+)
MARDSVKGMPTAPASCPGDAGERKGFRVSIRGLLAALSLTLVAVTAGITAGMSLSTAEWALRDTKEASALGLDQCFDTNAQTIDAIARDLLATTVNKLRVEILAFFTLPIVSSAELIALLTRTSPEVSADPYWLEHTLLPSITAVGHGLAPRGVSSIVYTSFPFSRTALRTTGTLTSPKFGGIVGINVQNCPLERYLTCLDNAAKGEVDAGQCVRPPYRASPGVELDNYTLQQITTRHYETGLVGLNDTHVHVSRLLSNGSLYRGECFFKTFEEQVEHICEPVGDCVYEAENTVTVLDEISRRALTNAYSNDPRSPLAPVNTPLWTPAGTAGTDIVQFLFFVISHPEGLAVLGPAAGPRIGFGMVGVDIEAISSAFRGLTLPTAGSRLYSVQHNPWENVTDTLTGTTHGPTWIRKDRGFAASNSPAGVLTWHAEPIFVRNATDPVIQEHARWVFANFAEDYTTASKSGIYSWTAQALGGVDHWVLTQSVDDPYGLLWYVTLLAPLREVYSQIDKSTEEIKRNISHSLDEVDEDRRQGFTVMLVVVCVVAVALMGAAVGLTVLITQPLSGLQGQMAAVALMHLEAIDSQQRLSMLSEMRSMQISFMQMVANLVEYRSYMPQSVLCATGKSDDPDDEYDSMPAPRGSVAIVFTDIVGSTRLWEASPEGMSAALQQHNDIVRPLIRRHRGYEVKTIGDAFMVSFSDPAAAALFAVQVQEALLEAQWIADPALAESHEKWAPQFTEDGSPVWNGITVRIGVAYGEVQDEINPITERADYRGQAVNLAARLESTALHGTVQLCPKCYAAVAGDARLAGLTFTRRPNLEMKGIGNVDAQIVTSQKLMPRVHFLLRAERRSTSGSNPLIRRASSASANGSVHSEASRMSEASSSGGGHLEVRQSNAGGSAGSTSVVGFAGRGQSRLENALRFSQSKASVATVIHTDNGLGRSCLHPLGVYRVMTKTVVQVIAATHRTQGKVAAVVGDAAHVSWNVIAACGQHPSQVLYFVSALLFAAPDVSVGIGSGPVLHGAVGSAKQKFHVTVGLPVLLAETLAREARALHAKCLSCFIPEAPAELLSVLYPVDTWGYVGPGARPAERVTSTQDDCAVTASMSASAAFYPALDSLSIEVPDTDRIYRAKFSTGGGDAGGGQPAKIRELYLKALTQGSAAAAEEMMQLKSKNKAILAAAERLLQFVASHPNGRSFRVPAPFSGKGGAPATLGSCAGERACESPELDRFTAAVRQQGDSGSQHLGVETGGAEPAGGGTPHTPLAPMPVAQRSASSMSMPDETLSS